MIITLIKNKLAKRSLFCLSIFFLFFPALLNAQTADLVQTLLQTKTVSYSQAADFVLEAADTRGSYDKTNAMAFAVQNKWLPEKTDADAPITLDKLSHLIMKAFDLKGGMAYSLFNSAHYSYRELVYRDVIQGRSDPQMKVSGEKMLFIVNRLLYLIEDEPWALNTAKDAQ